MVFPHTPNRCPEKQLMAHRKNPSPMAIVFPDLTAPSQTMASISESPFPGTHHVSTFRCFRENGAVVQGWQEIAGNRYYFDKYGAVVIDQSGSNWWSNFY
jgi:hypothetical protein